MHLGSRSLLLWEEVSWVGSRWVWKKNPFYTDQDWTFSYRTPSEPTSSHIKLLMRASVHIYFMFKIWDRARFLKLMLLARTSMAHDDTRPSQDGFVGSRRFFDSVHCVPNFVKIGQSIAEILQLFDFSRWQPSAILDLFGAFLTTTSSSSACKVRLWSMQ